MVVFTCGHCGESVQKPKVEKHYMTKCRNRNPNLSCMDCFKDFFGNDYETHTKCITEEERYSGKGFQPKEKKGEKKQNVWVEMIQSVLEEQKGASKNVLRIIETVSKHNNTPRKKPKFVNFVKNVCGAKTNQKDIDQAWDAISVKLSALSLVKNQNQDTSATEKDTNKDDSGKDVEEIENAESQEKSLVEDPEIRGVEQKTSETENINEKKSKKQRKEEKKRQKYEAELQSAVAPVEDVDPESEDSKKGKKKKNRTNSTSQADEEEAQDVKNKHKKRKRQDTINIPETAEIVADNVANKDRILKKKQKTDEAEEAEESVCLHDQNVAKISELAVNCDKFDWHSVIISLLQKKDNELPFKRLQKKVLLEYAESTGQIIDDRIADKFIKKLKSAPNVRVDKNRVVLLQ